MKNKILKDKYLSTLAKQAYEPKKEAVDFLESSTDPFDRTIESSIKIIQEAALLSNNENETALNINFMQKLIFDRKISTNPEDALIRVDNKPTTLYDGKYLSFPVFRLKEVIEASGIDISYSFLSHALTYNMNFKLPSSSLVCYKGCSKDSWQFTRTNEVLSWLS